ncbi:MULTISPECIES: hypothetical protein [unclassified Ensifer]|uniref:SGNH/GDSL hydrolase family protein n=1 Tax=unclassified Ensifer TaxID=2633371 RepID=UPI00070D5AF2|nr:MULTISPECIES: hypothetical protein [unclassified Ensifer]KQW62855.1 hypothetical protein ASD02_01665 [Ensifer sp. Root1252]KRC83676.1 hypothetical protein ASE32_01655 [Ensifer sp. Root231]KRD04029.1 hypothetical protein ASE47_00315 [Ensifer sp. Root258]
MSVLSKTAVDVFAPETAGGDVRSVDNIDAQRWGVELENAVSALVLSTNAAVVKATKLELDAVAGAYEEGDVGLVITDPVEALRGVYKKSGGSWVKQSDLPSDVARVAAANAAAAELGAEAAKTGAEGARDQAEDYRDQAAAIVNDIAQEKEVPIVGTVQGLSALTIPAGMTAIRFNGYATMGDGGAWPLAIEVSNSGTLEAWQRQSNGGTRRWQLATDAPTIVMFGGADTNSGDNVNPAIALRDFVTSDSRMRYPRKTSTGIYAMSAIPDLNGQYIDVDEGVSLKGVLPRPHSPGEMLSSANHPKVTRRTKIQALDNNGYDIWLNPEYIRTLGQKEGFISEGDLHRPVVSQLNPSGSDLSFYTLVDGADTFTTQAASGASAQSVTWNLTASTNWNVSLRKALWAEEMQVEFSAKTGAFMRVACVRCQDRYYLIYGSLSGNALNWRMKPNSVALSSGSFLIPGGSTHLSQQPQNALWSIQVINPNAFAVLVNGVRVKVFETASPITEFGFGVQGNAATNVTLTGWTLKKAKRLSGAGEARILVLGDSTAADIYGGWPIIMRRLLEGSSGLSVPKLTNRAVGGWNSKQVLDDLNGTDTSFWTTAGYANLDLTEYNVACLMVGANDIQSNQNHITFTRANVDGIVDYLQAAGIRVVVAMPSMFYSQALGGGTGSATNFYENGAIYRVQIETSVGLQGEMLAETLAGKGHILGTYKGSNPLAFDQRLRDNIHQTDGGYVLDAYNMACGVAAALCPETTKKTVRKTLWGGASVAGFTLAGTSAFASDDAGSITLQMSMSFSSQTLSNTLVYTLPPSLRPAVTLGFIADSGGTGVIARVTIDSISGEVRITSSGAFSGVNILVTYARE